MPPGDPGEEDQKFPKIFCNSAPPFLLTSIDDQLCPGINASDFMKTISYSPKLMGLRAACLWLSLSLSGFSQGLEGKGNAVGASAEDIFRLRVFEEPLVPVAGAPTAGENAELIAAVNGYA